MIRKALTIAAGVLTIPLIGTAASSQGLPIEWTLSPRSSAPSDTVQLALSYRTGSNGHNMNSGSWKLAELQGLTAAQLGSSQGSPATFRIAREAGVLDCSGVVRQWRGTGECSFRPDARYAAALQSRGIGRPNLREHYQLMVQDVGTPLIQELERQGYKRPGIDDLVAAGIHGVTVPYIRSMAAAGYRLGKVDELVAFRIHGVDADYVREMAALSPPGGRYSADQLVAMRIHGVSAAKAREYAQLGYRGISHGDLVSMAIHGVTPTYIRELADLGYRGLSASDLVSMRIHGVTPAYVRDMRAAGYTLPSAEQLVRMRISGFKPRRQ